MDGGSDREPKRERSFIQLAKLSSVGLEMGVAVALGWGIGYWLDSKLGTKPWLMIIFLLLGTAAGFIGMIRAAREANRSDRKAKE